MKEKWKSTDPITREHCEKAYEKMMFIVPKINKKAQDFRSYEANLKEYHQLKKTKKEAGEKWPEKKKRKTKLIQLHTNLLSEATLSTLCILAWYLCCQTRLPQN